MYIISDSTKRTAVYNALSGTTREFQNRISFGYWNQSKTFTAEHVITSLKTCTVTQNFCNSQQLTIGGFPASEVTCEFNAFENGTAITNYAYKNKLMFVECGVVTNPDRDPSVPAVVEYIPVGYFIIAESESDNEYQTVTVKGYDISADWTDTFGSASATTLWSVVNTFCTGKYIDFVCSTAVENKLKARTLTSTPASSEVTTLNGSTEKEAIAYIAGLIGCNARINSQNQLYFGFFEDSGINIPPEMQWQSGLKKTQDSAFIIKSITSNGNEQGDTEPYTKGTGAGITFYNPIIKHADVDAIYNAVLDDSYQPCVIDWRGNPCVEAGDAVTATYKGTDYTVYIASQVLDLIGGFSSQIQCPVGEKEMYFDSDVDAKIARVITGYQAAIAEATAAINGANGGEVRIEDTNGDTLPDTIRICETAGGTGKTIVLNYEGIGYSTDGGRTYRSAITGAGITANAITTGELNTNLITFSGSGLQISNVNNLSNKLLYIDNNGVYIGNLTAEQIRVGYYDDVNYADNRAWASTYGESYVGVISADQGWYGINVTAPAQGTSANSDVNWSGRRTSASGEYFRLRKGETVRISARLYAKSATGSTDGQVSLGLYYYNNADVLCAEISASNSSAPEEKYVDYTATDDHAFFLKTGFKHTAQGAFIDNMKCRRKVDGKLVVDGTISANALDFTPVTSANFNTYASGIYIDGNHISNIANNSDYAGLAETVATKATVAQAQTAGANAASAEIASFTALHNLTYIDSTGIYTGTLTAAQINVGIRGGNYANSSWSQSDGWIGLFPLNQTTWYGTDVTPIGLGISSTNLGTEWAVRKAPSVSPSNYEAFYVTAGTHLTLSARLCTKTHSDAQVEVAICKWTENGEVRCDYIAATNATTPIRKKTEWICDEDHLYYLRVRFYHAGQGSFVDNLECYINVSGEMVVNGAIRSVNGKTYFDLDNNELVTNSVDGAYKTLIRDGVIEQYNLHGSRIGKLSSLHQSGTTNYGYFITYDADNAIGLMLGSTSANNGEKEIVRIADGKATCFTTNFSGFVVSRDMTLGNVPTTYETRLGVGKASNTASASLELSNGGSDVTARLDVAPIRSSDIIASMRTQYGSGTSLNNSKWLGLGSNYLYYDNEIIATRTWVQQYVSQQLANL